MLIRNTAIPFKADDTVTNLSSCQLSSEELDALKNSLTHSTCPPHLRKSDIYTCFKLIHRSMFKNIIYKGQSGRLKADLSHLANVYVSSYQPSKNDVETFRILKRLRGNRNIVMLGPDRGDGLVILDRATYDNSINFWTYLGQL